MLFALLFVLSAMAHKIVYVDQPVIEGVGSGIEYDLIYGKLVSGLHMWKNKDEPVELHNPYSIKKAFGNCDYRNKGAHCSVVNEHWYLRTHISYNPDVAIITLTLFDEFHVPVASASYENKKKIIVIPNVTTIESNANNSKGFSREETQITKPPTREELPPIIISHDVGQVVAYLWLSL